MPWLTAADREIVEEIWPDADALASDDVLDLYLEAAAEGCEAYAPARDLSVALPASWKIAQCYQARNIWNAAQAGASGDLDGGGFGLVAHPLDWQVKQLLRPRRGVGAIL